MFDVLQKWSGYTKRSCKSQCANHICTDGFIKKYITILKLTLQGFLWKFNFESQIIIKKKLLKKIVMNSE